MALLTLLPPAPPAEQAPAELATPHAPVHPRPRPATTGRRAAVRRVRPAPRAVACAGPRQTQVRVRLTGRGRVVVAMLWMVIAVAAGMGLARPWVSAEQSDVPTRTVQVGAGDTLWELAGQAAPQVDRRSTVASIVQLNDLESAGDIHPGDLLVVPTG